MQLTNIAALDCMIYNNIENVVNRYVNTTTAQLETTASRQLKKIQNKTNSENGHLVFSILKKTNKKTTESVIFRVYI